MRGDEFFGPPGFCRVIANVAFEAFPNHVAAHGKRNAVGPWMRRTAGGKDELLDFLWTGRRKERNSSLPPAIPPIHEPTIFRFPSAANCLRLASKLKVSITPHTQRRPTTPS